MKHGGFLRVIIAFAASVAVVGAAFGETLYVSARTAQLRSGKTSLDPVVAGLRLGESLDVVKRDGRWLQVRTAKDVTGWIFDNYVSFEKPSGGDSDLAAMGKGFRGNDVVVTASAGARGLDSASEGYANRSGITKQEREAVDRMTAYKVPDDDIREFLKSGKLGEYAE